MVAETGESQNQAGEETLASQAHQFSQSIHYLFKLQGLEPFVIRNINFPHPTLEHSISREGNGSIRGKQGKGQQRRQSG